MPSARSSGTANKTELRTSYVDVLVIPCGKMDILINCRCISGSSPIHDVRPCTDALPYVETTISSLRRRFVLFNLDRAISDFFYLSPESGAFLSVFIEPHFETRKFIMQKLRTKRKESPGSLSAGLYSATKLAIQISSNVYRCTYASKQFHRLPESVHTALEAMGIVALRFGKDKPQYLIDPEKLFQGIARFSTQSGLNA